MQTTRNTTLWWNHCFRNKQTWTARSRPRKAMGSDGKFGLLPWLGFSIQTCNNRGKVRFRDRNTWVTAHLPALGAWASHRFPCASKSYSFRMFPPLSNKAWGRFSSGSGGISDNGFEGNSESSSRKSERITFRTSVRWSRCPLETCGNSRRFLSIFLLTTWIFALLFLNDQIGHLLEI